MRKDDGQVTVGVMRSRDRSENEGKLQIFVQGRIAPSVGASVRPYSRDWLYGIWGISDPSSTSISGKYWPKRRNASFRDGIYIIARSVRRACPRARARDVFFRVVGLESLPDRHFVPCVNRDRLYSFSCIAAVKRKS